MFYYGFKIMYSTDWWDTKNFGRGSCTITIRFSYEYEQKKILQATSFAFCDFHSGRNMCWTTVEKYGAIGLPKDSVFVHYLAPVRAMCKVGGSDGFQRIGIPAGVHARRKSQVIHVMRHVQ